MPALREAIRLEEEAQLASDGTNGTGKKPKRGRRAKVDDGSGEKIDGRAGPRSENIVLGKSKFISFSMPSLITDAAIQLSSTSKSF